MKLRGLRVVRVTFTARVCEKEMFSCCLCVCVSIWAITFECFDIET